MIVGAAEDLGMGMDIKRRLAGVMFLAIAAGAGWWGIWRPLEAARAHAPSIELSNKLLVLVPFATVFGLAYLIGGARFDFHNAARTNLTKAGWLAMAATAVATAGLFVWLHRTLAALGYPGA